MNDFFLDALTITVASRTSPDVLLLSWLGKSRDRQPARSLGPFLTSAVAEAAKRGVPLEMTFEQLEYMNSGTVMAIVHVIHAARKAGVKLRLVYDASHAWQRVSFDPMRVFADRGEVEMHAIREPASASEETRL